MAAASVAIRVAKGSGCAWWVCVATSARPERRPPSADAFRRRIEDYLGHSAAQGAIARGRERFERLRAASLAIDGGLLGRLDACAAVLRRGFEWWPSLPGPIIASGRDAL